MDDFRQAMFIYLRAQLGGLACKREAMVAANQLCAIRGEYPAYGEKDFNNLEACFNAILPDPHAFA